MFSLFSQSFRMAACGIALAGLAWGQIPLDDGERAEAWENRKSVVWKIESARRALGMGLYDLAVLEADAVLEMRDSVDTGALEQVRLIKADALLASGEVGQASRIYTSLRGEDLADLRMLRRAMVDFSRRDVEAAQIKLAQVNLDLEKLRQSDVAWWSFLKGWVELRLGSIESAEGFFDTAGKAALESPALKAQLSYLEFRLKISNGAALDRDELEGAYNDAVGTEIGYEYAKQLAIVLAEEGELERAIALLELQLGNLPEAYREIRDGLLLSELTLATVNRVEGQDAAENLLMNGRSEALMRAGLQQLVSSSMGQGGDLEEFLRERLDAIIVVGAGHPLLDETYYYRGALNFFTGDFDAAEEDARRFEELFPESEYRRGVYALRASTAWRSHLYRTAASALSRLRNEYAERYESTALAALIADCYFRAGVQGNSAEDFRSAAGAYRDAIEPMSKGKEAGETFYQLVLSYLKSGDIEEARRMVDSPDLRAKASSRYLWRAEWMLLEAMRASVDFAHQAYQRVQVDVNAVHNDDELHLRFLWMGTKLTLEAGEPDETKEWADRFESFVVGVPEGTFEEELIGEARSSVLLTLADSYFAIDDAEEAIKVLNTLREEYAQFE
ncbi:MAG: tetratricopeptide repeat protein, partial [Verrucomicrobiota bacterium]